MIQSAPPISVVLSVYNSEKLVDEAIESILNQTFNDFEFIIIDDASTDRSLQVIQHFEKQDERIRVLMNETNLGLTKSLNKAIVEAKGLYIARMDADDISLPGRFEKQLAYLGQHPEVGVLGGQIIKIDSKGVRSRQDLFPCTHEAIWFHLFFSNPMSHPAIMARKEVINEVGGYREEMRLSQDKDLWIRLIGVTKLANLSEPILHYRYHANSIYSQKSLADRENSFELSRIFASTYLGEEIPEAQWRYLNPYYNRGKGMNPQEIEIAGAIVLKLYDAFRERQNLAENTAYEIHRFVIDRIAKLGQRDKRFEIPHTRMLYWRDKIPLWFRKILKNVLEKGNR